MIELLGTNESREYAVFGSSFQEVGKAVDDFIARPLADGWELGGIGFDREVSHIRGSLGVILRTATSISATIRVERTSP